MHCTSCAMSIDGDLEDTDGIKSANTSYAKSETEVEFDENKITDEKIIGVIKKTGYKADSIWLIENWELEIENWKLTFNLDFKFYILYSKYSYYV